MMRGGRVVMGRGEDTGEEEDERRPKVGDGGQPRLGLPGKSTGRTRPTAAGGAGAGGEEEHRGRSLGSRGGEAGKRRQGRSGRRRTVEVGGTGSGGRGDRRVRQELDQRRGGVELEVVDRHGVRWSKGKATVARRDGEGRGDRARGSGASTGGRRGHGQVRKKRGGKG